MSRLGRIGREASRCRSVNADLRWDKLPVNAMKLRMTLKPQCLDTALAANRQADASRDVSGAPAAGLAPVASMGPSGGVSRNRWRTLSARRSKPQTEWQPYEAR